MQCLTPTQAWLDPDNLTVNGKQAISFSYDRSWRLTLSNIVNASGHVVKEISIPCGKCIICRKKRGFDIGIRARCENVLHKCSTFLTLTVSDNNLDLVFPGGKLRHRPWQLFAKRLRKSGEFRYLMCGEYGENTHRPHYHAIIFGRQFLDSYFDDRGCWHGSKLLEECWPYGHVTVSRCNDNRIMYVAGYLLKDSDDYPAYVRWSRRPGLGAAWFDKFWSSVYRRDGHDFDVDADRVVSAVIWHNKLTPFACRYFDQRLALHDERLFDMLKSYRQAQVGAGNLLDIHLSHSSLVEDFLLKGLKNRVELYNKKLASRTRDLHNCDYATYVQVIDKELQDEKDID